MSHPERGTCNDRSCRWHGVCHCGCGQPTRRVPQNRTNSEAYGRWVKGNPSIWASGAHVPGQLEAARAARTAEGYRRHLDWLTPRDRVSPLARWLVTRCGSLRRAAIEAQLPLGTFKGTIYSSRLRYVTRSTAQHLVDAVLASRYETDLLDGYQTYAKRHRPPTPAEIALTDRWEDTQRRKREAEQTRKRRGSAA